MEEPQKWKTELSKLKAMSLKQKLEYIWMYYKPVLAGILLLVVAVFVIKDWYQNASKEDVLFVVAMDALYADTSVMEEGYRAIVPGIEEDDQITIDNTMVSGDSGAGASSNMKLAAMMAAKEIDVMLMPEEMYREYSNQDAFMEMSEVLTAEELETYKDDVLTDAIRVGDSEVLRACGYDMAEPVYMGVMVNTQRLDNARLFVNYIMGEG